MCWQFVLPSLKVCVFSLLYGHCTAAACVLCVLLCILSPVTIMLIYHMYPYGYRCVVLLPPCILMLVFLSLSLSPDHPDLLCSGSRDNSICLWDLNMGRPISSMHIPRNLVSLQFHITHFIITFLSRLVRSNFKDSCIVRVIN